MKLAITSPSPGVAIVAIPTENLDASNVKEFREAIMPVVQEYDTVLVDMTATKFVDSSGLGALLACLRTVNNKNGSIRLFGLCRTVRALFELVRMHRIFEIYESESAALENLPQG
ncbi:MAG: STAS domain-containing protein [Burkholderiales bacterium]